MLMDMICRCRRLVVIMAACCLILPWSINQALAYTPPIGIPDPGFGIDDVRPARPEPWTSELSGYYYVDMTNGSDTARTYGHPGAARKTIPSPAPAGSYIEVHGETIVSGVSLIISGNGTSATWSPGSAGPVWIVGQDIANRPVFNRKIVVTGSYIYFDTLKVRAPGFFQVSSPTIGYPADHIVLRNSDVEGSVSYPVSAVSVGGASLTSAVNNVVVYKNTLHDAGDITITSDQDKHITTVGDYTSRVWFLENTMHTGSGSGAQVSGASDGYERCHHIYYGNNHVYNTRQAGLAVKYASDVIFSQNVLHDIIDTRTLYVATGSPSKGVGFQYSPQRLWILYNIIYNASYGIVGASTTTSPPDWYVYAIGNVIYNTKHPTSGLMSSYVYNPNNSWSEAGIMMAGGTHKYIVNNTIINSDAGIYGPYGSFYIANNIISNINMAGAYHIFVEGKPSTSTVNNSILFQNGGQEKIKWGSSWVGTLTEFQNYTGKGENSFNNDPEFVDSDNKNFKLNSLSPAVDAGIEHEVYATFYKLYGLSIQYDRDKISRPTGEGWDIGAYEFSDSIVPKIMNIILR